MHKELCTKGESSYPKVGVRGIANHDSGCDHSCSMSVVLASIHRRLTVRLSAFVALAVLAFAAVAIADAQLPMVRTVISTMLPSVSLSAVDTGQAPSSQRMLLTLTMTETAAQTAALDGFLREVNDPSSANYHHWLTPQQFAANYGATADRIAVANSWLTSQGLSVESISAGGTRIVVSGFEFQIESAFAVSIHQYQVNGHIFFSNALQPSLPADVGLLFAGIDGLANFPTDLGTLANGNSARASTSINTTDTTLSLLALSTLVDTNSTAVLSIDAIGAIATSSPSQIAGLGSVFRQAAAQGITSVVYRDFATDLPYGFPEVTNVAVRGGHADNSTPLALRPSWQIAVGLPADGLRHAPDVSVGSVTDLSAAIELLARHAATGRLGNINPTLYSLAPLAGLYSQPDSAVPGTWEPTTGLGLVDVAQLAKVFPRGSGPTGVQISSSSYSPTHGQSFVLSVTASSTTGGTVPTGTIAFTAPQLGFNSTTATMNGSGLAQSTPYILPGGTYLITAAYSGDVNYAPSNGTVNVTVQAEDAGFSITAPATVGLGATISATVTLSSPSGVGTPSASVTVTPSGILSASTITQTIAGTGGTAQAVYSFTTNKAGSVSLQASCTSSDPSFTCFTPQTSTTTVPQATPKVALTMTPTNPAAGIPVTLSATVTGVSGIGTTGSVQFFDGPISLGFGSAPTATFSGNLAPGSTHVITAVYQGDANYLKATSNAINTSVSTSPTTTTVNASATTLTFGQSVSLNISVATTTVVNGTQPTGTLTFTGAGSTTTAAVSGGSANVTLSNLGVGTWTIGTSYSGDTNYSPSTGNTVTITVTQATASLSVNLSSTAFTTSSTSTLTVTVTLPGTAVVPTGSTFIASIVGLTGATYTGTFAVNVGGNTGTGAVTIPAPPAGTYTMQVTCGTNLNFTCAPNALTISSTAVGAIGTTVTRTTLAISPMAPALGQQITLTATVSAAASATSVNPIAGIVNFYDGTKQLASGTIVVVGTNGVATARYTFIGTTTAHTLTAVYAGNIVYASSTSTALAITVSAAAATVALTSNVTTVTAGSSVVLTATVTGSTTTGAGATGSVSFYIAGPVPTLIGTATLGTSGSGVSVAVYSTSTLPSGSLTIYATYNGDTYFSSAVSNNINLGLSDYILSFIPTTMTIQRGLAGTSTGVLTLINAFPGTVVLGCAAPSETAITCGFNPTVISGGGVTTLRVSTTQAKGSSVNGSLQASLGLAGGFTLAALFCWCMPGRGRRRIPGLLLIMLALGLTFNTGCSANNFNVIVGNNTGTPLGTTILTITTVGTNGSSSIRHNYVYQVTIQ